MRIIYCGDVVGKTGRRAVAAHLPGLRARYGVDFAIVNGENAAHGFGITEKICDELARAGADAITTGNHTWDQREMIEAIDRIPQMIRPLNYPEGTPGKGAHVFPTPSGKSVLVAQIMGRLFMDPLDDPFRAIDRELQQRALGDGLDAVVVDIHAEATSEKMAVGHYLDGRASMVVGTHTHVPSADAQILPGGTGYQTDIGMCGDYDSVIGMKKAGATKRFIEKMPSERLEPAEGEATLCAVLLETDEDTGLAARFSPLRVGGRLAPCLPDWG